MITPDRKVRKLMEEYQRTGKLLRACLRADLDPKTGRKYLRAGKLPSQMRVEHTWRTRSDAFARDWPEAKAMLEDAPELEAVQLVAHEGARAGEALLQATQAVGVGDVQLGTGHPWDASLGGSKRDAGVVRDQAGGF